MKPDVERECARRLLLELGHRDDEFTLESARPPATDVRVLWPVGRADAFEVTDVHPDEVVDQRPAQGRPAISRPRVSHKIRQSSPRGHLLGHTNYVLV